jgi:hypothetical protein
MYTLGRSASHDPSRRIAGIYSHKTAQCRVSGTSVGLEGHGAGLTVFLAADCGDAVVRLIPVLARLAADGVSGVPALEQVWWHVPLALLGGLLCWWAGGQNRTTVSLAYIGLLTAVGVLWIKTGSIATDIDRLATERPISQTAPRDGCVHPRDRTLRYGLSYYWGFEVPECNDATIDRRIFRPGE